MELANRLTVDDGEMPARRQEEREEQEDLEMTEVLDDTAGLLDGAAAELGGQQGGPGVYSPVKTVQRAKRPAGQDKGQVSREDQKCSCVNSSVSVGCQEGQATSCQDRRRGEPWGGEGAQRPYGHPE